MTKSLNTSVLLIKQMVTFPNPIAIEVAASLYTYSCILTFTVKTTSIITVAIKTGIA